MERAFGGSDAAGAWDWKTAYDACEAATVLFLRKFGPAIRAQAGSPAGVLQMLGQGRRSSALPIHAGPRRARLCSSSRRRSSLPSLPPRQRAPGPADIVLEPSAGTGLLAIFAELAGSRLVLNELAEARAGLLNQLFPGVPTTRHDGAHIHDHLDGALRPSVVLMNPPFSVAAHVDGAVADAALRHVSSALARLADGGRLVAITGASVSPIIRPGATAFVRLQQRGRVVFSAAIEGRVYARHGTTVETRLTVIDRLPARRIQSHFQRPRAWRLMRPRCSPGSCSTSRRACLSTEPASFGRLARRHPCPYRGPHLRHALVERGDSVRARRHRAGL